jgi:hypothetical protein
VVLAQGCVCLDNRGDNLRGVEVQSAPGWIPCGRAEGWKDAKISFGETGELVRRDPCRGCGCADNGGDNGKGEPVPSIPLEGSRGFKESRGDGFGEVTLMDLVRRDAEGERWNRGADGNGCIGNEVAFFLLTDGLSPS